jgi:hypothetical protein
MFRHFLLPQGAYTNISLQHTAIHNLQKTYICFDVISVWSLLRDESPNTRRLRHRTGTGSNLDR